MYREDLLGKVLQNLVGSFDKSDVSEEDRKSHVSEVLSYTQLLFDNVASDVHTVSNYRTLSSKYNSLYFVFCGCCFLFETFLFIRLKHAVVKCTFDRKRCYES